MTQAAVSAPDPCRFCRYFAALVPAFAVVMGTWTSLQLAVDPAASEQSARLWSSLVRATAPAASGSALLLALLLWAHPLRPAALQVELPRIAKRAAAVALPGYVAATGVALLSGLALVRVWLGPRGVSGLSPRDFVVGALFAALDGALLLALAWRFLPRLQASRLSLPAQLSVAIAVTVPLRATAALLAASVLSP